MLLHAHSGLRYLVLLMGLVVVAYAAYGLATKAEYGKHMRVLSAIFTGVIDLTVLLGIIMLFTGMFYPQLAGHIAMMILAAGVGGACFPIGYAIGAPIRKPAMWTCGFLGTVCGLLLAYQNSCGE